MSVAPGQAFSTGTATAGGAQAGAPDDSLERQLAPPTGAVRVEACPLCGSALHGDQDWCLQCGAAARTRLAATPNWKAPVATFAVIAALALGVLAAALVKLAGGSGTATPVTSTVTTAASTSPATAPSASGSATGLAPSTTADTTTTGAAATGTGATGKGAVGGGTGASSTAGGSAAPSAGRLTPAEREALRQAESPLSSK